MSEKYTILSIEITNEYSPNISLKTESFINSVINIKEEDKQQLLNVTQTLLKTPLNIYIHLNLNLNMNFNNTFVANSLILLYHEGHRPVCIPDCFFRCLQHRTSTAFSTLSVVIVQFGFAEGYNCYLYWH